MSVFQLGTNATDKLFLEYILPGLNIQIRENTTLYDRFDTNSTDVKGKYATFKNLTASPKSARPSSSSTLPTAKQGTYHDFDLRMKRGLYAQLQFDGLAVACGQGKGAVMELLKAEIIGISTHIANKMNRQFWGDGSGRLAELEASVSNSVTMLIDGPLFGQDSNEYTNPGNFLDEGMSLDVYDTSGNLEIEDIDLDTLVDSGDGTGTITLASAQSASSGSFIFDHDTYASGRAAGTGVPMGLEGIVHSSDPYTGIAATYFQGVERSTHTWAQAQMEDMGDVAITNTKMLKAMMKAEKFGRVKVIITNDVIWRTYYEILEADKTMPNEPMFWGGTSGLAFYGGRKGKIPIIYDYDCPDNKMFFLDTDFLKVYSPVKNGMSWIPGDNGILTRVQGKDEWTASLVWYYNFGCTKPQAQCRLYDIKHASS